MGYHDLCSDVSIYTGNDLYHDIHSHIFAQSDIAELFPTLQLHHTITQSMSSSQPHHCSSAAP